MTFRLPARIHICTGSTTKCRSNFSLFATRCTSIVLRQRGTVRMWLGVLDTSPWPLYPGDMCTCSLWRSGVRDRISDVTRGRRRRLPEWWSRLIPLLKNMCGTGECRDDSSVYRIDVRFRKSINCFNHPHVTQISAPSTTIHIGVFLQIIRGGSTNWI